VRGGYDPQVHGLPARGTHGRHNALLKNAQELGLHLEAHVTDLASSRVPPSAWRNNPLRSAMALLKAVFT